MIDLGVRSSCAVVLPAPRIPITIRPGVMADIPFIDSLQKAHTKQVGWMPMQQLEQKIGSGHVLVAEQRSEIRSQTSEKGGDEISEAVGALSSDLCGSDLSPVPVGYVIGTDQYFKRDDCGIIYQLAVAPGKRRSLIGAALLQAQFDRSAYGCRLYCCWCAQDIEANHFWEAMGFVPLAFRAGARNRDQKSKVRHQPTENLFSAAPTGRVFPEASPLRAARVHIFWQKRIREGDTTTPYWFPSQTTGGSIREDRLVFPIPPGMEWSDEMPRLLPSTEAKDEGRRLKDEKKERRPRGSLATRNSQRATLSAGGLRFVTPKQAVPEAKGEKPKAARKKRKNDPKLVAKARELRDRWLEQVNTQPGLLRSHGKYEVSRAVEMRLLAA